MDWVDEKEQAWREENHIQTLQDHIDYFALRKHEEKTQETNNRYRGDFFEAVALTYFNELCMIVTRVESTFEKGYDFVVNAKRWEVKGIRDLTTTRVQRFVLSGEQLSHPVDFFMFIIESAATGTFAIRILTYKEVLDLIGFRADNVKNKYLITIFRLLHFEPRALININGGVTFFHLMAPKEESL